MTIVSTLIVILGCIATGFAAYGMAKSDDFAARSMLQQAAVLAAIGVAVGFVADIGSRAQQASGVQVITVLILSALVVVHFSRSGDDADGES